MTGITEDETSNSQLFTCHVSQSHNVDPFREFSDAKSDRDNLDTQDTTLERKLSRSATIEGEDYWTYLEDKVVVTPKSHRDEAQVLVLCHSVSM